MLSGISTHTALYFSSIFKYFYPTYGTLMHFFVEVASNNVSISCFDPRSQCRSSVAHIDASSYRQSTVNIKTSKMGTISLLDSRRDGERLYR